MRYYLVALFDKEDYIKLEGIQKNMSRKYKIYKNLPMLHLTIEVLDNPNINKLEEVIKKILKPYKKFKIKINGAICFEPPYKSVNLKVESKGYIIRLVREINEMLKLYGFKVRENIDNWDLHISVANVNFSNREWSYKEYSTACNNLTKDNIQDTVIVDRFELWKPINNKKDMVVKAFPLREY